MSNPKLAPVPKNDSLWRPEKGSLVIEIRNDGDDMTKPVKVKVTYPGMSYGNPPKDGAQELELKILKKGESYKLHFELPNKHSFEPDFDEFDFRIIIDEGGPLVSEKAPTGNKKDIK